MMKKAVLLIMALIFIVFAVSCGTETLEKFSVYCFNAGAADAFLLKTDNSAVLIDTAESNFADDIICYLNDMDINKLDYLIITHFDDDHVGGVSKILKKISVNKVLQTEYVEPSKKYENYLSALEYARIEPEIIREELSFSIDGADYKINPPDRIYDKNAENNSSLIVSVEYGDNSFLFCGDAEKQRLQDFLQTNDKHFDFVKMPHHGRWNSKLTALVESSSPQFAVITSSAREPEDEKTLKILNKYSVKTYFTRKAPVILKCDGHNISADYN